jgi:hypothetical protein
MDHTKALMDSKFASKPIMLSSKDTLDVIIINQLEGKIASTDMLEIVE